jgi:predicted nucleic acid-binding protein
MNKTYVFDAGALLALFQQGQGFARVNRLMKEALVVKHSIMMSAVNWGEAFAVILRTRGEAAAQLIKMSLTDGPIQFVSVTPDMAVEAGRIKVNFQLSYADSFAAALAIAHHATLVTGDSDFQKVARQISILWLRRP